MTAASCSARPDVLGQHQVEQLDGIGGGLVVRHRAGLTAVGRVVEVVGQVDAVGTSQALSPLVAEGDHLHQLTVLADRGTLQVGTAPAGKLKERGEGTLEQEVQEIKCHVLFKITFKLESVCTL